MMLLVVGAILGMSAEPPPLRPRKLGASYSVPTWLPASAQEVNEPSAVKALGRIQRDTVKVETASLNAEVATSYWRTNEYASTASPKIVFMHGADSSCLEWRYVAEKLGNQGLDCTCVDWWTGGWTDRLQITKALVDADGATKPWTLVREHLAAFLEQQVLDSSDEQIILIGASLGGAAAIDFAAAYPSRVRALILIDAGGQSYKAPPPEVVKALAPAVVAVKSFAAWVVSQSSSEEARIGGLHRTEAGWSEAYAAYLASGGYVCQVGPALIRTLTAPTLVIWGVDDNILPLADAYSFQADLQQCVGVREVAGAGHSPHLDDPETVAQLLSSFLEDLGEDAGRRADDKAEAFRDARPPIG